ncbi:HAMP domain-containing histidine kinase [Hymenobacter sp. 15J16-1T3B]|uniref:sensor histidine kinase n=1 Tax=Hymenobacter sp. 15J16-1T3B TaxID=2886941 RepID=UPI001D0F5F01|nr:HAMP domain-containing sensor histidine kinase [Hymenobacter sp. 15J16-1T3B]MCC3160517.1 HAMP domain-containing histidine kinase [Hymenobacter sp. 15J16-1T3B]
MKRRIRTIFWLMAACILGINGFQAYWLYNTYQLSRTQFERTTREALLAVVQRYQLRSARQLFGRTPGPGQIFVRQFSADDAGTRVDRIVVTTDHQATRSAADSLRPRVRSADKLVLTTHAGGPARRSAADTTARRLSRIIINDWAGSRRIDLPRLTADYRAELRLRNVATEAVLDTLTVPAAGALAVGAVPGKPARPGYPVQTPPVPFNPLRALYVQAAFPPPTSYLLRQMGGLLAGSVLLLGLTTGCFVLMLNTILRQKKLADVKNDFINNMTHELKTPLATVSAAVEALQHFGALHDPQKAQTYLSISQNELQRLSDLVEKVLNIAVEERQALQIHPEPVHPAALVQELVQRQQLKAPKPVHFQVDIEPADVVPLDVLHLGNVINNLIDNAIKYSREQVTIVLRGRRDESGWRLTVQDDGIGIPKSYQDAIFDRFFRVPTGNLHPVKGFGLGLYYARQVVERHGGRLAVRSEPNRGSEFSLWLPV